MQPFKLCSPRLLISAFLALCPAAIPADAQCDAGWLPNNRSFVGYAMGKRSNGEILVGGANWNGLSIPGIGIAPAAVNVASYNPQSGGWTLLGHDGIDPQHDTVWAITELPGRDVVIAGRQKVHRFNDKTHRWSNIANFDGPGTGRALAVLQNGDVILGGSFGSINGVPASNIVRYNPTSGVWSPLGSGTNAPVNALTVLPSGELIVGGEFQNAGGTPAKYNARYNPSTGGWISSADGLPWHVMALASSPAGELVALSGARVFRFDSLSNSFTQIGAVSSAQAADFRPNGDLVVGGWDAVEQEKSISHYNWSTGVWTPIGGNISDGQVFAIAAMPDGGVLVAGELYSVAPSTAIPGIMRNDVSTGLFSFASFKAPNGPIADMTLGPNNEIYAVGSFTAAGFTHSPGIAMYQPTTGGWFALGTGLAGPGPVSGNSVVVRPTGEVVVGGTFTSAGGVPANNIASYDPGTGTWSALGDGLNGTVNFVGSLPGGDLLVNGTFTTADGVEVDQLARYNPSTRTWSPAGGGPTFPFGPSVLKKVLPLPDGDALVGGVFNSIGGQTIFGLARYNPSTGAWSPFDTSVTRARVYDLLLEPDGTLYVVGDQIIAQSLNLQGKARYDFNTGVWSSIGSPSGFVGPTAMHTIAKCPDGDLIFSGGLIIYNGQNSNAAARYRPSTDQWFAFGTNWSIQAASDRTVIALPDGTLVAGGDWWTQYPQYTENFQQYAGSGLAILSQLPSQSACRGSSASFSVSPFAVAGSETYQWRRNGVPIDPAINPTAHMSTLTLTGVKNTATYDCVVSGLCGNVAVSNATTLSICASDLNCDSLVEDEDFQIFLVGYSILDCADPTMPAGCSADINQDGFVDDADFQHFIVAYNLMLCD